LTCETRRAECIDAPSPTWMPANGPFRMMRGAGPSRRYLDLLERRCLSCAVDGWPHSTSGRWRMLLRTQRGEHGDSPCHPPSVSVPLKNPAYVRAVASWAFFLGRGHAAAMVARCRRGRIESWCISTCIAPRSVRVVIAAFACGMTRLGHGEPNLHVAGVAGDATPPAIETPVPGARSVRPARRRRHVRRIRNSSR